MLRALRALARCRRYVGSGALGATKPERECKPRICLRICYVVDVWDWGSAREIKGRGVGGGSVCAQRNLPRPVGSGVTKFERRLASRNHNLDTTFTVLLFVVLCPYSLRRLATMGLSVSRLLSGLFGKKEMRA